MIEFTALAFFFGSASLALRKSAMKNPDIAAAKFLYIVGALFFMATGGLLVCALYTAPWEALP